jgi:transposase
LRTACPRCHELEAQVSALERRVAELTAQVDKLIAAREEVRRGGKRQAAPFRKAEPKPAPKKPGRKSGDAQGPHAHRAAILPEQIDERYEASLPDRCPHGSSRHVRETHTPKQYQTEIPRRPIHREFTIHIGQCQTCSGRV